MPTDPAPERILAEGKYLRFVIRDGWEFIRRVNVSGIIGIVPITDEGKLVLVEQYRPPVDCHVIELPAGLVGDVAGQEAETLETAASRELIEETGYHAAHWTRLVDGAPSAGASGERMTLFLATGLTKVGPGGGDHTESIRVHEVPLPEVPDWLNWQKQRGIEIDLKVYAGLFFAGQLPK
jgi:ADP-ribose pyrophosphatase